MRKVSQMVRYNFYGVYLQVESLEVFLNQQTRLVLYWSHLWQLLEDISVLWGSKTHSMPAREKHSFIG